MKQAAKTAKAAVAERCIGLKAGDDTDIDAERGERIGDLLHQAEVRNGIAHQAADGGNSRDR